MNLSQWDFAASPGLNLIIAPVVGLIVVGVLIAAFAWGRRIRARESRTPRPDEQPKLPEGGPVWEVTEVREPDEMPRQAHDRILPHELKGNGGTRTSSSDKPREWNENSGGGFGSGGFGG